MENKTEAGNATPDNQAVVVTKQTPSRRDYTMGLFDTDKFFNNDKIARVFGLKPIYQTDKNGVQTEVGMRAVMPKRGELAQALELQGKDNRAELDAEIEKGQRLLLAQFKAWLIMQPDNAIGITRYAVRRDKNGANTHTVAFKELPDRVKADMQKLADAHGIPVDKLAEFIASLKGKTVEVEATVTTAAAAAKPAVVKK
jgi:hypothetical protein